MKNGYIYDETQKLIRKYKTRDPFKIMDDMHIIVGETSNFQKLKGFCFMSCKTIYVQISSFLSEEEKQIVFGTDDFFVDEKEDYQVEWIIPNAQKNQMEPILMTLYPHKKSHIQTSYTGEEFGYVLKGNITIMRGGKKYKVKAHETFYMDGAKSHYLYNHGNSPAKILWITTPPIF